MKTLKVSVDIDGVLADFAHRFSELARTLQFAIPDGYIPHDWNWKDSGLSEEEVGRVWDTIKEYPNFWLTLKPINESVESLSIFLENHQDIEVFYVTSRIPTKGDLVSVQSKVWLDMHCLLRPQTTVLVKGRKPKSLVFDALGITHSIDDHTPNVSCCTHLDGFHCLLRRPWNQDRAGKNLNEVDTLDEFLFKVRDAIVS